MYKPQFKGYVLEEILAYLIRTTGYNLITKAPANDSDMTNEPNGLNIKGRGSNHQVDVLGELKWIPAFNFPLRLMVEAKFRKDRTGIEVIREQVGILSDVNENYFTATDQNIKKRYRYTSVVFSTSGFAEPAIDMAIAHQIPLIDLSGDEYQTLKNAVNFFTEKVFGSSKTIAKEKAKTLLYFLRKKFRNFHTEENNNLLNRRLHNLVRNLIRKVRVDYGELFVGMSVGGFLLILKEDSRNSNFVIYSKKRPTHNIEIWWSNTDNGKKWIINPMRSSDYKLTFTLPKKLHKWIYQTAEDKYQEAINAKEKYFSRISIYYRDKYTNKDYIFNLKFKKENILNRNNL